MLLLLEDISVRDKIRLMAGERKYLIDYNVRNSPSKTRELQLINMRNAKLAYIPIINFK